MRERGIKRPLTKQEKENLEWGRRMILEMQIKARNLAAEKARASGIHAVPIPVRKEA
jgi:hypothetical protein